jgi:hypothetical protein
MNQQDGGGNVPAAGAQLPAFIDDYNARFGKPPVNKKDLHRSLRASDDLEDALAGRRSARCRRR